VDHIGIFLETPNVDPLCGPPNATLGETRPQWDLYPTRGGARKTLYSSIFYRLTYRNID
jgi:hypothetical protein